MACLNAPRVFPVRRGVLLVLAGWLAGSGCGPRREPASEAKLAQALEALQHSRLDEAARHLASVDTGGGWLRSPTWTAPLALRLRANIALRRGAQEETVRLLQEYADRFGDLAPAAYARRRLDFLARYGDWQGTPALIYLRGLEAADETPAVALRQWRILLRDYGYSSIAPTARLKLGRLQQRLGNAAWALAELTPLTELELDTVDPHGNPVAPQALLTVGQIRRDLMHDSVKARAAFNQVLDRFGGLAMVPPEGGTTYAPATMARFELAEMAGDGGAELYAALAGAGPPFGYVTSERIGDARAEARLRLAGINLRARRPGRARERLLEILPLAGAVAAGPPNGPRRSYAIEVLEWMETRVAAASAREGLEGLSTIVEQATSPELWALAQLSRVRVLARVGRQLEARDVLAEMEERYPDLACDPGGVGLWFRPAAEARRVLGG